MVTRDSRWVSSSSCRARRRVLPACLASSASSSRLAACRWTLLRGLLFLLFRGPKGVGVFPAHRPFGHRHDAEIAALLAPAPDGFRDLAHLIGNLRQQNDIRSAGDARAQREPARAVSHDFGHHDAVVAVGGAVEPVDGFGGNPQRRVKADRGVGHRHIIVNRLGQRQDAQSLLGQPERILLCAAAAQAHQRVEAQLFAVLEDDLGHVARPPVDFHPMRLVAARPEDRPADGENAGQRRSFPAASCDSRPARGSRRGSR